MHIPTYLHCNSYGIWYFRIAVPQHLRYTLQVHEIKKSLRTLNRCEALRQARRLAVCALDLFEQPGVSSQMVYTWLKIKTSTAPDGTITEEIEMDPTKPEEEAMLLKAHRESQAAQHNARILQPAVPSVERIRFSEAAEKYKAHICLQGKWEDKTRDENDTIYKTLIECVTDLYMDEITVKTAEDFLQTLRSLPPNRKKLKSFKNKTVSQIVAMNLPEAQTMSKENVNKYIRRVSQLCHWAVRSKLMDSNPFSRLSVKNRNKAKKRISFDDNEIALLLSPQNFEINPREPHKYWLPILAALTGARLEELAQLRTSDIQTIDGLECICFTDLPEGDEEQSDKDFKTASAIRTVPIHSKLKELNFIQFFAYQKLLGHKRLFPGLKPDRYGTYSAAYSKHFTRYRRKCQVDGNRKAFHSFRHSVATKLKRADMHPGKSAAVVGHYDGGNFTFTYYGEPYLPAQLVEIVESINYGRVFDSVPPWRIDNK